MITTVLFIIVFLAGVIYFWFIKDYSKEALRGQKPKEADALCIANRPTLHSYAQAQISFGQAIAAGLLEKISYDKALSLTGTERLVYEVGIMDRRLTIILNIGDQSLCIENKKEGFFEEMPSYYAEII